ncbi:aminopeptidase C [Ezakiella peruensis]|uniref:aminopeptidase C n=1 Tax=Ezakiella peruensis TaxID=1464038 RepID=UPI000C1B5C8C|nr:C1 family peptidase [Ezakiella peruensis]
MKQLSIDKINEYEAEFLKDKSNLVRMNAGSYNPLNKVVVDINRLKDEPFNFNNDIKNGEITNQKASGRCWMFASMNVMRNIVMKKLNLENFEFSQSYTLFCDKLERANYYLEAMTQKAKDPIDDREVQYLMGEVLGDGGQWDMFVNLVKKYGLVPKYAYPESTSSSNTRELNKYLVKVLHKYTVDIRKAVGEGKSKKEISAIKEEALQGVYNVLTATLGRLPEKFDFIAYDKDNKLIEDKNLNPQKFFEKYVEMEIDDYVSLINAPTEDKPFGKTYTIKYLGNVIEGKEVKHLNLAIEDLKAAVLAQLKDGMPVWFGCDVGKDSFSEDGRAMLDTKISNYDELFGIDLQLSKADALDYYQSQMTHAMTFTGVEVKDGKSLRFKVENSWGDKFGYKGHYTMTDDWFDKYVYQAVVNKKYLSKDMQKAYDKDPVVLKPWDPMGSLA